MFDTMIDQVQRTKGAEWRVFVRMTEGSLTSEESSWWSNRENKKWGKEFPARGTASSNYWCGERTKKVEGII